MRPAAAVGQRVHDDPAQAVAVRLQLDLDVEGTVLALRAPPPRLWVHPLDDHDAVQRHVLAAAPEERAAIVLTRVHQIAHEEHAAEGAAEVHLADVREQGLSGADGGEHLGRIVHCRHGMAEGDEGARDPAGAAAELEDGRARRDDGMDELGLAHGGQELVELGRAAVGRPELLRLARDLEVPLHRTGSVARDPGGAGDSVPCEEELRNSSWIARTAFAWSASWTQNEMFSSLEPCAIAITLTPARTTAPNTRAATPGVPRIPSPTAATTAIGFSTVTRSTS